MADSNKAGRMLSSDAMRTAMWHSLSSEPPSSPLSCLDELLSALSSIFRSRIPEPRGANNTLSNYYDMPY